MKRWAELRLRLRNGNARPQARHDMQPIIMSFQIVLGSEAELMRCSEKFVGVHREIEVGSFRRIHSEEFRRSHTDDRERQVVNLNRLPCGILRVSKAPLRKSVADHGHCGDTRLVVAGKDWASSRRRNTEPVKKVSGYKPSVSDLGLPFHGNIRSPDFPGWIVPENLGEEGIVLLKNLKRRK